MIVTKLLRLRAYICGKAKYMEKEACGNDEAKEAVGMVVAGKPGGNLGVVGDDEEGEAALRRADENPKEKGVAAT